MLINILLILLVMVITVVVIAAVFGFVEDVLDIDLTKIVSNKWTKSKLYKYLKSLEGD